MKFTRNDYRMAVHNLVEGLAQLEPNGNCCSICGDNGHQAWECHHNPLVHSEQYNKSQTEWRCFHCDQVFTDEELAREHFGEKSDDHPVCQRLCSGLGIFPNGDKCKGCADCKEDLQVVINYFKDTGKWYTKGSYETSYKPLYEIWKEVREMFRSNYRPGLVDGPMEFFAVVEVPDHEHNHQHLILPSEI